MLKYRIMYKKGLMVLGEDVLCMLRLKISTLKLLNML